MRSNDDDYRVISIETSVTQSDINKGVAGEKVALQVEQTLKTLGREGFEFHNTFPVNVNIKPGCFGTGSGSLSILVMVFRRPLSQA